VEGIDKVADLAPIEVGLKETETLAEAPEASVWEEALSLIITNCPESVPVMVMPPTLRLAIPSLVMVTVLGKLDEPDWIEPKSRLVGLTEISASLS